MASNLPPQVASGELITSAWGNQVVAELQRLRGQVWAPFLHAGSSASALGTYDNGTTNLGPFTYPVRVTVMVEVAAGVGTVQTQWAADIIRLDTGGVAISTPGGTASLANAYGFVPLSMSWDVTAGLAAGFKTRTAYQAGTGTFYYSARGHYYVQRTDA